MLTGWRKKRLRAKAKAHRADAAASTPEAARELVKQFPDEIWPKLHSIVAGYRPIGSEIDPTPLLETFHCEQARIALPCVEAEGAPLKFRAFSPGDELETGAFGVEAPKASASVLVPALVLVPLLAFDRAGRRLGYGGGYYDRTLDALRAAGSVTVVGVGYGAQEVSKVPADKHDQRLDWIITEVEAIRAPRASR